MHYFWFVPLFVVAACLIWVFYLAVARGLPPVSNRSVSDALAEDQFEEEKKVSTSVV